MTAQEGITAITTAQEEWKSNAISITHADQVAMYDREYERLMSLSKEKLVEMIIGKRELVGVLIG